MPRDEDPDPVTGMWVVRPEFVDGQRAVGVVHLDSIYRASQFLPVFGTGASIPPDFHFHKSLKSFRSYYVNKYIDYHSHECFP